jgi:hypothetical protein
MSGIKRGSGSLDDIATVGDSSHQTLDALEAPHAEQPARKRPKVARRGALSCPQLASCADDPFAFEFEGQELLPPGPASLWESFLWPLAGKSTVAEWTILSVDLSHHVSIPVVSSGDFQLGAMDFDAPYVVKDVNLKPILAKQDRVISCWIAGFDRSEVVTTKGRSTWGLQNSSDIREALLKYSPACKGVIESGNESFNSTLARVNLFGDAGAMRNSSGETQSMACMRWQMEGRRRVIIASVSDISRYMEEEAATKVAEPTAADISATLKFADSVVVTALRARGARLHHAEILPNQLLFQPAGWWVLEAPLNSERNFGIQVSVLPAVTKDSKTFQSFAAMKAVKLRTLTAGAVLERTKT